MLTNEIILAISGCDTKYHKRCSILSANCHNDTICQVGNLFEVQYTYIITCGAPH